MMCNMSLKAWFLDALCLVMYLLPWSPKRTSDILYSYVLPSNISLHSKPEEHRRQSEMEIVESDIHICVNCMRALVNTSVREKGRDFVSL